MPSNPEFICNVLDVPPSSSAKLISFYKLTRRWQHYLRLHCQDIAWTVVVCLGHLPKCQESPAWSLASVFASSVLNDSSFNNLPHVFKRDNRMIRPDWICLSQMPPMWLDDGGFLCQMMQFAPIFGRKYWIFWWSISLNAFPSSFCAPTKLEPLSLHRTLMLPLLAINCCRACMKESVFILQVHSIFIALLAKNVKSASYLLSTFFYLKWAKHIYATVSEWWSMQCSVIW